MSQRNSDYPRRPNEDYPTPAWVTTVIAEHLQTEALRVWEPAAGNGALAEALAAFGYRVTATTDDFFAHTEPPDYVDAIVTNPPYGDDRRGALACAFIAHALKLDVPVVAMLLRVDFDSAKTRAALFRDCPHFAGKIVLLDRIQWFPGASTPSDNHAWFVWEQKRRFRHPWIRYAEKAA